MLTTLSILSLDQGPVWSEAPAAEKAAAAAAGAARDVALAAWPAWRPWRSAPVLAAGNNRREIAGR